MPIQVRNLKLPLDTPEDELLALAAKRLRIPPEAVKSWKPVRRSLDARRKNDIHFVYHVELVIQDRNIEKKLGTFRNRNVEFVSPKSLRDPEPGEVPHEHRPVVVGFGSAGMFAALRLAAFGYRPIVLERGRDVKSRHKDILLDFFQNKEFHAESNILFGEGGAGTYSDGKLYTRVSDPTLETILETFVWHGADPEILIDAHPHIGSDRLPSICRKIREHIEELGGEIRFESRVEGVEISNGQLSALVINGERMEVGPVILAIGHSARDTVRMLADAGIALGVRPFQIGVRIEHPQQMINTWQYGSSADHPRLPVAEYRVVSKKAAPTGGDLFSFCMCPGGVVLPTIESPGLIATNGASRSDRGGEKGNSGLVMTISPEMFGADPLSGLEFVEAIERTAFENTGGSYSIPCQRASDFLTGKLSDGTPETTWPLGSVWSDIRAIVPPEVSAALENGLANLDSRMPGFAGPDAMILAPETRTGSPVRILRDRESCESMNCQGLYPTGEGAGYAGGIVSAALDGLRIADRIIKTGAPCDAD